MSGHSSLWPEGRIFHEIRLWFVQIDQTVMVCSARDGPSPPSDPHIMIYQAIRGSIQRLQRFSTDYHYGSLRPGIVQKDKRTSSWVFYQQILDLGENPGFMLLSPACGSELTACA